MDYDDAVAAAIEKRVQDIGADGKLVLDNTHQVYQVNLFEKLLVPLLCKISNLVADGGIWLNTQRPEWNDANNALVGQGLSMVTLYYLRRYITFFQQLIADYRSDVTLSTEVIHWLEATLKALSDYLSLDAPTRQTAQQRFALLTALGEAASDYRKDVYRQEGFSGRKQISVDKIKSLLSNTLLILDASIHSNKTDQGLYHAYNLLDVSDNQAKVHRLYAMLEGQVAALSSGAVPPQEAVEVLEALFASDVFRADQKTFMLYPDRPTTRFLDKNRISAAQLATFPLAQSMLDNDDQRLIMADNRGQCRFNADLVNLEKLESRAAEMLQDYPDLPSQLAALKTVYEDVFDHQSFTGRSGGMFGFEGLGCVYWHMVSKLLLAVMENVFIASEQKADVKVIARLCHYYYRVREGIGFQQNTS